MYKRILVALDGSVSASLALEEALKLAQAVDATLMVACVVSHDVCDLVGVIGEQAADAGAHWQLDHVRDLCERSGVRCITQIIDAHGASIPDALMQAAQAFEADLIVMGAHGPRGVRRHLIGSVAETVLRSSHVPVLTVRDDQRDEEHDDKHDAALAL
ncbi:Putative universal stress protein (plasmid) [Caballeronia sp. SBC1]|uniref:universal stress protein n=1 Tax=unclassified Caballeronia TaxID=2646786 RepID=UPI0013E1BAB7|nr:MULTISPECIES: universal stress protein [unclassified Caballeronia]QIE25590.1 Putative universal stress protein [Caballeronia sp. SBC2]QIN65098.1 Putative universal stress protein [Caballeronia sp. SBC1]